MHVRVEQSYRESFLGYGLVSTKCRWRACTCLATEHIIRYTAVRLREECAILEINTRVWVPATWARLAELRGTGSRGSRVFHVVLGEGQVVDMYETTNFGLKCLDILSLLHTVNM